MKSRHEQGPSIASFLFSRGRFEYFGKRKEFRAAFRDNPTDGEIEAGLRAPSDAAEASAAIVEAASSGELTPSEAGKLLKIVESYART
jgi:hypothetical protein